MKKLITIGLLSFASSAGMFASPAARANDLEDQLVRARAVEAVIWSMPAISIREFVEATFKDYGATWNDIILWSKPAVPRHELLTANNQVPYMLTTLNLRQGPVVVEIPAAGEKAGLFGSFVDNWQAPIVDVGPSGRTKARRQIPVPSARIFRPDPRGLPPCAIEGYVVAGGLRPCPPMAAPQRTPTAYAQQMKVYPLADAAAPKPTRFIDGYPKPYPLAAGL